MNSLPKVIDLRDINSVIRSDTDSFDSMVLCVKGSGIKPLPDWIVDYVVPVGTIASATNAFTCYTRLLKMRKETGVGIHPVHQVESLLMEGDVTVKGTSVGFVERDKSAVVTYNTVVGYLVKDVKEVVRICAASTADLIATDGKISRDKNFSPPNWPENFKVPKSDGAKYRKLVAPMDVSSRAVSRDMIFKHITEPHNNLQGMVIHSMIGKSMDNYFHNKPLEDIVKKFHASRKVDYIAGDLRIIGIDKTIPQVSRDLMNSYRYYFHSIGLRGDRNGKGLSHGYERFSTTRSVAENLNLVVDFKNVLKMHNATAIMIKNDKYLTDVQVKVLVANGITVQICDTILPVQKTDKIGAYSKLMDGVQKVEFIRFHDDYVRPKVVDGSISMGKFYDTAMNHLLSRGRTCFAYMYLDIKANDYKSLTLIPSATADSMCFIATNKGKTYKLPELAMRASLAVSCRNNFVHSRLAFSQIDPMGDFVDWRQTVVLPCMRVRSEKESSRKIELSELVTGSVTSFEPMDISANEAVKAISYVQRVEIQYDELFGRIVLASPELLYCVICGIEDHSNPKEYLLKRGYDNWPPEYDDLFTLSFSAFQGFLMRAGSPYYQDYQQYAARLRGKEVAVIDPVVEEDEQIVLPTAVPEQENVSLDDFANVRLDYYGDPQ